MKLKELIDDIKSLLLIGYWFREVVVNTGMDEFDDTLAESIDEFDELAKKYEGEKL